MKVIGGDFKKDGKVAIRKSGAGEISKIFISSGFIIPAKYNPDEVVNVNIRNQEGKLTTLEVTFNDGRKALLSGKAKAAESFITLKYNLEQSSQEEPTLPTPPEFKPPMPLIKFIMALIVAAIALPIAFGTLSTMIGIASALTASVIALAYFLGMFKKLPLPLAQTGGQAMFMTLLMAITTMVAVHQSIPEEELAKMEEEAMRKGHPAEYVEADFHWDEVSTPHKDTIIKGVNMIARTNKDCYRLEAGSAGKSGSRGTDDDPVFFVTCYTEADKAFNVFFSKSQVGK